MIGINFPFAREEEKRMSGPSRLKGEKDHVGLAHYFVNNFYTSATDGRGEERKEGTNILWRRLAASLHME